MLGYGVVMTVIAVSQLHVVHVLGAAQLYGECSWSAKVQPVLGSRGLRDGVCEDVLGDIVSRTYDSLGVLICDYLPRVGTSAWIKLILKQQSKPDKLSNLLCSRQSSQQTP